MAEVACDSRSMAAAPQHHLWMGAVRACVSGFAELGLDTKRVLAAAGIDPAALDDPDGRVPMDVAANLWPAAQRQWRRPGLGLHTGARLPFGGLGVFDYVVACAPSLGEGLRDATAASVILSGGATRLELARDARGHGFLSHVGFFPPQVRDYGMTALTLRMRRFGATPLGVSLVGPPLAKIDEYREILGLEPRFEAEHSALELSADDLDRPRPDDEFRRLTPIVDREIRRLVAASGAEDLAARVRRTIARSLPSGTPSLTSIARRLGLSTRTLQRRLAERKLTLRGLVDDTRHELARRHLESDRLHVAEIGFLLGYADPSTFAHAFKRWSGVSPSEYRKGARG